MNYFPVMFTLVFVIVISFILIIIIRGIVTWSKNNASPRIPVEAKIVSKRGDVSAHYHHNNGDITGVSGSYHTSSTSYYATFEFSSGDRMELNIPGREYGLLAEGDSGTLTFQGTRFIGFERKQGEI
ncbi:MAG: DUF2500 domain-containing protein [Oscillospiraceae bacterium]|jgi:hypothetical protein|nr:DUF2500 domain-containing protein [Oscillospiraceae bacterium]